MKLTKKDVMTKPGILHYTPQLNKALYCRYCLMMAISYMGKLTESLMD